MPTHLFTWLPWPKNKKSSVVMHVHFAGISTSVYFHFLIKCQLHECYSTRDDYCVVHLLELMMQGIPKVQTLSSFPKAQR